MSRLLRASSAIVRGISRNVTDGLRIEAGGASVSFRQAQMQHFAYQDSLHTLLSHGGSTARIYEIPADDDMPDCCFVEDTVIVQPGRRAMITRPGAAERRLELPAMRECLEGLGCEVSSINDATRATIDGGDVLYTGDAYFVGLSRRTNAAGAAKLRVAAGGIPVVEVPMEDVTQLDDTLHLKSAIALASEDVILCGPSSGHRALAEHVAQKLVGLRKSAAEAGSKPAAQWGDVKVAQVDELAGANAVLCNGALMCRTEQECPGAYRELDRMRSAGWIDLLLPTAGSELEKIDGALTCCSVLLWEA